MSETCPRCGAQRPQFQACPECGFEESHPGVLGSYKAAFSRIVDEPELLLPFAAPTLLVAFLRAAVSVGVQPPGQGPQFQTALLGLVVLFLGLTWYFVAIGSIVPRQGGSTPRMPGGSVYVASAQAGLLVVVPLVGFVALMSLQSPEELGAVSLLAAVMLLLSSLVVAGRAIGIPIEAAARGTQGLEALKSGNDRGRENGGLGLVFLAVLLLFVLSIASAAVGFFLAAPVRGIVQILLAVLGLTFVGALVGVAAAIALTGGEDVVSTTFTCPRCGREAHVEGSTASCECGLEGTYKPGPSA